MPISTNFSLDTAISAAVVRRDAEQRAAPDLLASLIELNALLDVEDHIHEALARADAAIAKARGEA